MHIHKGIVHIYYNNITNTMKEILISSIVSYNL